MSKVSIFDTVHECYIAEELDTFDVAMVLLVWFKEPPATARAAIFALEQALQRGDSTTELEAALELEITRLG